MASVLSSQYAQYLNIAEPLYSLNLNLLNLNVGAPSTSLPRFCIFWDDKHWKRRNVDLTYKRYPLIVVIELEARYRALEIRQKCDNNRGGWSSRKHITVSKYSSWVRESWPNNLVGSRFVPKRILWWWHTAVESTMSITRMLDIRSKIVKWTVGLRWAALQPQNSSRPWKTTAELFARGHQYYCSQQSVYEWVEATMYWPA